jgi:hypothetical protein
MWRSSYSGAKRSEKDKRKLDDALTEVESAAGGSDDAGANGRRVERPTCTPESCHRS